ncbi:MAG: hypothetical protein ACRC6O_13480 [Flavobacterium sp.]
MKNKLIWITFALFLSSNSLANAAERTISSVIKAMADGADLASELKKPPVFPNEEFSFIKKDIDNEVALYAVGSYDYPTYNNITIIYVKIEKDRFYAVGQKLPKGKYKFTGITSLSFDNSIYDALMFERVK